MDTVEIIARLALAAVFTVAGLAKLADRPGSLQALEAFGLPATLARPGAIVLPLAELSTAALLIPGATATAGAAAAIALLLAFCAGITRSIVRGETHDCHCFGQLHSEPVGPATLARNAFLAAAAGLVLVAGLDEPPPGALDWVGELSGAGAVAVGGGLLAAAALAGAVAFVLGLLRRHGEVLLRLDAVEQALARAGVAVQPTPSQSAPGLPVGTPAPAFSLSDQRGKSADLTGLLAAGKPLLLVFTDPGCGPCTELMPAIAEWQSGEEQITVELVSRGSLGDNAAKAAEHGLGRLWIESEGEVSRLFGGEATPTAVLIGTDGRIASPLTGGGPAIRALVASTIAAAPLEVVRGGGNGNGAGAGLAIGDPIPDVRVERLEGGSADLTDLLGARAAILFWNPGCGFCRQMLDDLHAWESDSGDRLVLLSAGTAEANRAQGLRSEIVLDPGFAAATRFGASGTPSAILVEDGRIASRLGVGAPACMDLLRTEAPAGPAG